MTSTLTRKALVAFRKATFDLLRLAAKAHANAEAAIARLGGGKLGTLAHMALNRGRLRPLPSRAKIRDRLYGVAKRAYAARNAAEAAYAEVESAIENANAAAGVQCDGGMPTWYASAIVAADGLIAMAHDPDESLDDEIYIRCVSDEARRFDRERFERLVALAEQECVRAAERPNGANTRANTSKVSHPESADVRDLCAKLAKEHGKGKSDIQIARDFVGGKESKAKSLMTQARRYPHLWKH